MSDEMNPNSTTTLLPPLQDGQLELADILQEHLVSVLDIPGGSPDGSDRLSDVRPSIDTITQYMLISAINVLN